MKKILTIVSVSLFVVYLFTGCTTSRFSFIVTSDIHFQGANEQQLQILDTIIGLMDNSERLVKDATGSSVDKPLGVFITGDITNDGRVEQWEEFEEVFGLNGDTNLKIPVYETFGNHDGAINGVVREGIRERNKLRNGVSLMSDNGLHYVIKKNGHLFIVLGSYPGNQWDPECDWCHYFKESFREADGSLTFLENVLEKNKAGSDLPVFLFFHYGWDDFSKLWWTQAEQDRLRNALQGSKVQAIFHGHNHQIDVYKWQGHDVFISGSPQRGAKTGEFLLVSVDRKGDQVFVVSNSEIRKLK